jgi:hypothetical protein
VLDTTALNDVKVEKADKTDNIQQTEEVIRKEKGCER